MHQYGLAEVEKLLQLPRSTIRSLVKAGFVAPARGPRKALLFSFQDLVVLRKAQALVAAKVPAARIARAMKELRRQAESGQYALEFEAAPKGALRVLERRVPTVDWFGRALAYEMDDPDAAVRAYEKAIAAQPELPGAYINLGRIHFEGGRLARAERTYREGIKASGGAPLLFYNLGVLLDEVGRRSEALRAYQEALRGDPSLADCHYNLALICEELGRAKEAIRHLAQYRRLTRRPK